MMKESLPIQYPIIQAPMAGGATTPALIAAVSNAGGLGSLGAGYMAPSEIKKAIQKIRLLTDHPFSVNLFIPKPHQATTAQLQQACDSLNQCCSALGVEVHPVLGPYTQSFDDQIQVVFDENIPIVSFTFGVLDAAWIDQLKSKGVLLIGTATTVEEACFLEKAGVDQIVLQGSEAGGHRGTFLAKAENALVNLSCLLTECKQHVAVPLIAAGGIMNGREIAKMLALGADAVQMGTAFLSCHESGISAAYKAALLAQKQDKTVLTSAFSGKLARGIQNKFIDCMADKQSSILDYPIQNGLTQGIRRQSKAIHSTEFMAMWAGQSAVQCRALSAKDLMKELVTELEEALEPL